MPWPKNDWMALSRILHKTLSGGAGLLQFYTYYTTILLHAVVFDPIYMVHSSSCTGLFFVHFGKKLRSEKKTQGTVNTGVTGGQRFSFFEFSRLF